MFWLSKLTIPLLALTLVSCSSTKSSASSGVHAFYLRSEFTWWQATENFRFINHPGTDNLAVNVKVFADGNFYNIKIADKLWSEHTNCGPQNGSQRDIVLNQWIELNCSYDRKTQQTTPLQNPLRFKPSRSDTYKFEIRLSELGIPTQLMVSVAN